MSEEWSVVGDGYQIVGREHRRVACGTGNARAMAWRFAGSRLKAMKRKGIR